MKARIVKKTWPNGTSEFTIQQRCWHFPWIWVDAWMNYSADCRSSFSTLEEARRNLILFTNTPVRIEVVE